MKSNAISPRTHEESFLLHQGPVAQWIRRRSTEPEIPGSIPGRINFFFFLFKNMEGRPALSATSSQSFTSIRAVWRRRRASARRHAMLLAKKRRTDFWCAKFDVIAGLIANFNLRESCAFQSQQVPSQSTCHLSENPKFPRRFQRQLTRGPERHDLGREPLSTHFASRARAVGRHVSTGRVARIARRPRVRAHPRARLPRRERAAAT